MTQTAYVLPLCILFSNLPQCQFDGEEEQLCTFMSYCVLPCTFQPGLDVVVIWERLGYGSVFEYGGNQEALTPHKEYRGRVSLFLGDTGISNGNASMMLEKVRVQDEGQYTCVTSTSHGKKTTNVLLRVKTSVEDVLLELKDNELVCTAENIYPEPKVSWTSSTGPQDQPRKSVKPSESGLFSVSSSVPLTASSAHEYTCNISTEHSWRSATYRRNPEIPSDSLVVPCTETTSAVRSLIWKFNHAVIYKRTREGQVFSVFWARFVQGLTEFSGLRVKYWSQEQQGLFSCELSTVDERFIIVTEVTQTKDQSLIWKIIIPIIIIMLLVVAFAVFKRVQKRKRDRGRRRAAQGAQLKGTDPVCAAVLLEGGGDPSPGPRVMVDPPLHFELSQNLENRDDSDIGSFHDSSPSLAAPDDVPKYYDDSSGFGPSEGVPSINAPPDF